MSPNLSELCACSEQERENIPSDELGDESTCQPIPRQIKVFRKNEYMRNFPGIESFLFQG